MAAKTNAVTLHIVIVSHDPMCKVQPIWDALAPHAAPSFRVTFLSSDPGPNADKFSRAYIDVVKSDSQSIFHMRARIPAIVGDCEWVIVLEDHNHIGPDWADAIKRCLSETPQEVDILVGTITNLKSTSPWCWGNFINVLGAHWHPITQHPIETLVFNTAIRRSLLGDRTLPFGDLEAKIIPQNAARMGENSAFPADHYQPTSFWAATQSHWRNGKTTGAIIATQNGFNPLPALHHSGFTIGKRHRRISKSIRTNPNFKTLPPGTLLRAKYLAIIHGVGAIYGWAFGAGRAPWKLE